jgi:hypothetical protein
MGVNGGVGGSMRAGRTHEKASGSGQVPINGAGYWRRERRRDESCDDEQAARPRTFASFAKGMLLLSLS